MPYTIKKDRNEMKRELALLLAKLYAEDNDETPLRFTFDNTMIITLGAGEIIQVDLKRIHKNKTLFPQFDLAGVIGYEMA